MASVLSQNFPVSRVEKLWRDKYVRVAGTLASFANRIIIFMIFSQRASSYDRGGVVVDFVSEQIVQENFPALERISNSRRWSVQKGGRFL